MIGDPKHSLSPLRRQWLLVTGCYLAALLLGYLLLERSSLQQIAWQWLLPAAAAMIAQLAILWHALPYNRRQGGSLAHGESAPLLGSLGYANALTLLRGLLICLLAGFLFAPAPAGLLLWMPALLYTLERLMDFADGYVARITRRETKLGEILDIEYDSLGFFIAILLGIQYGKLPPWYLLMGLFRGLFVLGLWLRRRRGLPIYELPPSDQRRVIAGFQTGFVTVALWPLWPPSVTLLAAYLMALPLIFSFGRDWLAVSGAIDATSATYQRLRRTGKLLIEGWLPLVARLCAAGLAFPILWQVGASGMEGVTFWWGGLILLGLLAVLSVLLGVVGRAGALLLAILAALGMATAQDGGGLPGEGYALLFVCAVVVLHLGSGKLALWRPEEKWLRAKLGAAGA